MTEREFEPTDTVYVSVNTYKKRFHTDIDCPQIVRRGTKVQEKEFQHTMADWQLCANCAGEWSPTVTERPSFAERVREKARNGEIDL